MNLMWRRPLRLLNFLTFGLVYRLEDRANLRRAEAIRQQDRDDPIILSHPVLGDFLFSRLSRGYARDVDWCGKSVIVTVARESPLKTMAILDEAATFFSQPADWRTRIAARFAEDIPEMRESWNLAGSDPAGALWRTADNFSIWFEGDGAFQAHFEANPQDGPWWVSAHGTVKDGIEFVMVEA